MWSNCLYLIPDRRCGTELIRNVLSSKQDLILSKKLTVVKTDINFAIKHQKCPLTNKK